MSDSINDIENTEKEINLIEIVHKLWIRRRFIIKACIIGGIVGLIIAFSIPKEYTTTVTLAPKPDSKTSGSMGTLAAMAGIDLQQKTSDVSPELYPSIVKSTPFLLGLLNIQVVDEKQGVNTVLYDYLDGHQKKAWWSYIFGLPSKMIGWFSSDSEDVDEVISNDSGEKIIVLTKEQKKILEALKEGVGVSVDKKTGVITLSTTMQSANISAMLVDTLTSYLQDYIISYRTEKARQDLAYTQTLYNESQEGYFRAQQKYAEYIDRHQNIVSASFRVTQERLQNEMNLAYNVYNQMAQQLQMAKIKVQDETPVYTVIQPAEIPLSASAPRKMLILIGFVFLSLIGVSFVVLFQKGFFKKIFLEK